jgi:hypothetical protein
MDKFQKKKTVCMLHTKVKILKCWKGKFVSSCPPLDVQFGYTDRNCRYVIAGYLSFCKCCPRNILRDQMELIYYQKINLYIMGECLFPGLSYTAFKAHAQNYIFISASVWLYHIFLRNIWQRHDFREGGDGGMNMKYMSCFHYKHFSF